ncbi:DUF2239 family protein [Bosea sp. (in: a-proteobacteria)]|uniref:DUF2239 family protein n=1 Tax=Bosea sp. (in: a-proteobacteria) TaxID=1871050 RepID=UPI002FC707E5
MIETADRPCAAFDGETLLARGPLREVALAVQRRLAGNPAATVLTFDDATGRIVDLDLRGSPAEILARFGGTEPRGRGRPKLGVVAREVTLLPRHWDWLSAQPGGASQALRRLVDAARRGDGGETQARIARETAYRFMAALAGNLPGFEEASRALFAGDERGFAAHAAGWPADIRTYAQELAWSRLGGAD